jgi:hypothetical protein
LASFVILLFYGDGVVSPMPQPPTWRTRRFTYQKRKNRQLLRIVKDVLGLQILGVYRIPCECGKIYIGQTGRSIEARFKEYMRHIRLDQPEKSAVA